VFLRLGLISFGGPVAHLGFFHAELVRKRKWMSDAAHADLVALCQFLPGPASSQVAFALGMHRAGLGGALLASLLFLLPSAAALIAFGYGVDSIGPAAGTGWLAGLRIAAVGVVAQAVWTMARRLCPDLVRIALCVLATLLILVVPNSWIQVGAIAGGAVAGWLYYRRRITPLPANEGHPQRERRAGMSALALFVILLAVTPFLATITGSRDVAVFDSFFRSGSFVFGGGHVVLPLLRAEVVPAGWVTDDAFLAGYGAAQAIPGPLFAFAGYLGTRIYTGSNAWIGGLWCLLAIFLPSWLLSRGTLPFWNQLRTKVWAQAGIRGANAVVVGILLAALYPPVITEGIHGTPDAIAAVVAFSLLQFAKVPPWAVVLGAAAAGQYLLR
jgi:chromate transporter